MKLNIKPAPRTPPKPVISTKTGFESPIGWWHVTTEGDCEGRTTDDLGDFYGHVAEIALATKCHGYSLRFSPRPQMPAPAERPVYTILNTKGVYVSLDIGSGTWDMDGDARREHFTKWFDTEDVIVKNGCYYASVFVIHADDVKRYELEQRREKLASEAREREREEARKSREQLQRSGLAKLTAAEKAALGIH